MCLIFNYKQQNLFEFGNAKYTNLNASMFQNLCAISRDSMQSVTTADNNTSIMLQIEDIPLFRYIEKKHSITVKCVMTG